MRLAPRISAIALLASATCGVASAATISGVVPESLSINWAEFGTGVTGITFTTDGTISRAWVSPSHYETYFFHSDDGQIDVGYDNALIGGHAIVRPTTTGFVAYWIPAPPSSETHYDDCIFADICGYTETYRRWTDLRWEVDFADSSQGKSWSAAFAVDPAYLASVPEPATWAVMITGFGLVGAAARRRRQVAVRA